MVFVNDSLSILTVKYSSKARSLPTGRSGRVGQFEILRRLGHYKLNTTEVYDIFRTQFCTILLPSTLGISNHRFCQRKVFQLREENPSRKSFEDLQFFGTFDSTEVLHPQQSRWFDITVLLTRRKIVGPLHHGYLNLNSSRNSVCNKCPRSVRVI